MAFAGGKKQHVRQPDSPVVDFSNPLSAELAIAVVAGLSINSRVYATDALAADSLSDPYSPSDFSFTRYVDCDGLGFRHKASANYRYLGKTVTQGRNNCTLTAVLKFLSTEANSSSLIRFANSSGWDALAISLSSTGTFTLASTNAATLDTGIIPDVGKRYVLTFSCLDGVFSVYINGQFIQSSTGSIVNVGYLRGLIINGGTTTAVVYYGAFVHLRGFSAIEARSIAENPWQLFRAKKSWFSVSSTPSIDLLSDAQANSTATGALDVSSALTGTGVAIATADGVVNQSVSIAGSAASIMVAEGLATLTTTLSGDGFSNTFASGAIHQDQVLSASAASYAAATGALANDTALSGAGGSKSTAAVDINLTTSLTGAAIAAALAQANLDAGGNDLVGDAQSSAAASGHATLSTAIAGTGSATVTGSAGLAGTSALTATAVSIAAGSGDLTIGSAGLTAWALAEAVAGGSLSISVSVSAAALANAIASAMLTLPGRYQIPVGVYTSRSVTPRYSAKSRTPRYSSRSLTHA